MKLYPLIDISTEIMNGFNLYFFYWKYLLIFVETQSNMDQLCIIQNQKGSVGIDIIMNMNIYTDFKTEKFNDLMFLNW